ncbi:MAG: hypothetical protein ACTH1D_10590 [Mycobacteriaceae bacterium]|uniref:hypothetical protein n=1 Tax=Corynebacterium sp. TaxID=1720 RepID=UPI003F9CEB10
MDGLIPDFAGPNQLPLAIGAARKPWPGGEMKGEIVDCGLVPGCPPHIRGLSNFCFGLPMVTGDVVETAPVEKRTMRARKGGRGRRKSDWGDSADLGELVMVTRVRALVPGVLAVVDGCSEQSRRESPGPGLRGRFVPHDGTPAPAGASGYAATVPGTTIADGIVEEWWLDVVSTLTAAGCDIIETDGDRIMAFWGWRDCRDLVQDACLAAGFPADRTQTLDWDDRAAVLGEYMRMKLRPKAI